jgi:hypothetical protein
VPEGSAEQPTTWRPDRHRPQEGFVKTIRVLIATAVSALVAGNCSAVAQDGAAAPSGGAFHGAQREIDPCLICINYYV